MLRSYKNAGGIPVGVVIELATAGVTEGSVEVQITDVDGWLRGVIPQLTCREVQQELRLRRIQRRPQAVSDTRVFLACFHE